jgi:hypothetical protein
MKRLLEAKSRRLLAIFGIIALAAVIGFSFVSCIINLPEDDGAPSITTSILENGAVGISYSYQLRANGYVPITWDNQTSLPYGLTLSSSGLIFGIPLEAGTYPFTVRATNSAGTDTKQLSIRITSGGGPGPGPGSYDYTGDNIADFRTWLAGKNTNSVTNAYKVRLNISNLGGSYTTTNSLGWALRQTNTAGRYVSLDLSDSTFTSIPNNALQNCTTLTEVTMPNSVTSIGTYAFSGCNSLTDASIGSYVTTIGERAFSGCISLTSVTIPSRVTNIGNNAFYECSSITSVSIGNSVTSIGERAFQGCSSMTDLTIGNSVNNIMNAAFEACSSLTSVIIPSSVNGIAQAAFYQCGSLTSVRFMGTIPAGGWSTNTVYVAFPGDLRTKFYATDKEYGTPGTYTRAGTSWTWIGN